MFSAPPDPLPTSISSDISIADSDMVSLPGDDSEIINFDNKEADFISEELCSSSLRRQGNPTF